VLQTIKDNEKVGIVVWLRLNAFHLNYFIYYLC